MKKILLFMAAVIIVCSSFQRKKIKRLAPATKAACIQNKIAAYRKFQKHDQPLRVVEYVYNSKKVYYVVAPCCDQLNQLYDANCNLMGNPDGGFTGRGDGKFTDFEAKRSNERILWKSN